MGTRAFKNPKVKPILTAMAGIKAVHGRLTPAGGIKAMQRRQRRLRKPETPAAPKPSDPAKELRRSTSLGMGLK